MIILGVPVLRRYDLLAKCLASFERGSVKPDRYVVIDNGGQFEALRRSYAPVADVADGLAGRLCAVSWGKNLGVAASWNAVIELGKQDSTIERLVIAGDDVEVGESALEMMSVAWRSNPLPLWMGLGMSFFSLGRDVLFFDENFFPAYFEDNDYLRRMALLALVGIPIGRMTGCDVREVGSATLHDLTADDQARFGRCFERLSKYYEQKWGGGTGAEKFALPFDGHPPEGWTLRPVSEGKPTPVAREDLPRALR